MHGSVDWPVVLPLYAGSVAWTLVYDTIYAHQDKRDDARLGLRSTALYFGQQTKPILAGFATAMVGGLALTGLEAGLAWPFWLSTGVAGGHLAWQIMGADLNDSADLARRFDSNKWLGAVVFAGIVGGRMVGV